MEEKENYCFNTYNELLDLQHQILRYKMCVTDGEMIWYFESWEWKC